MSSPFYQEYVPSDDVEGSTAQQYYIKQMLLAKTDQLNNASNSTKRMIEFNESYRKKQSDYNWLVIYVIIAMIIFVFFVALKFFIPTIPQIVMDIIYTHIFGILLFIIFVKLYFIWSRNNMNYDEINVNVAVPNNGNQSGSGSTANSEDLLLQNYFTFAGNYSFENINGVHYIYFKDGNSSSIKYIGKDPITVNVLMVGKGGDGTTTTAAGTPTYTAGVGGGVAIGTIDLLQNAQYDISVSTSTTSITKSGSLITITHTTTVTRPNLSPSGSMSEVNVSNVAFFDSSQSNSYQWMDGKPYAADGSSTATSPTSGAANTGNGGDRPTAANNRSTTGGTGIVAFAVSLPSIDVILTQSFNS
jgi:hypothetical protein